MFQFHGFMLFLLLQNYSFYALKYLFKRWKFCSCTQNTALTSGGADKVRALPNILEN
jgi:hypothetical protein